LDQNLLITGISQLLTLRGSSARRGAALSKLGIVKDGAVLVRDGRIAAVGTRRTVEARSESKKAEKLDIGGRVAFPGFVDSHTHLIHAASRAEEYELKIRGASYEEIARKGGGILNSVKKLRAATKDALKQRARAALEAFVSHGTTTIEAKSGYGLDAASELNILTLQKEIREQQPIDIVSTFLGAHVVPEEFRGKADGAEHGIRPALKTFMRRTIRHVPFSCSAAVRQVGTYMGNPVSASLCAEYGREGWLTAHRLADASH